MVTPQQPPQQPIYPHDLNLALDRHFTKFTNYTSARYEELAAQVRIGNEESLMGDTDLANAILRLTGRVSNIETRVTNIENTQQAIIKTLGTLQEQMAAMPKQMAIIQEQIKMVSRHKQNGIMSSWCVLRN